MDTTTVVNQLHALGVQDESVVLAHTSFSKVGPLDDGPDTLIDALIETIGPDGTLVMPSWAGDEDELFDPSSTSVKDHLGIVADTFWRRRGVHRSKHLSATAAIGPHAEHVTSAPLVLPPHAEDSGIARVHDLDGWVLLLGVGHDSDTTIHLGELLGGAPYFQINDITLLVDGRRKTIFYGENDHCCQRFAEVGAWLTSRGLQREGTVGNGPAVLVRSRDVVRTVVEELRDDPCRFLHPRGSGCAECDETWVSVLGTTRMVIDT